MFFEIDAIVQDLNRRMEKEKGIKNKILLEEAIASLKTYNERTKL